MSKANTATRQAGAIVFIAMAVRVVTQGLALILLLVAGQILSVEMFGLYVLATILMQFSLSLMFTGIYNFVLKEPEFDQYAGTAFSLHGLFAVVFAILIALGGAIAFALMPDSQLWQFILATALVPLMIMFSSWQEAMLLRRQEVKYYYFAMFVAQVAGFTSGVIMLKMGYGVWSLILSRYVSSTTIMLILSLKAGMIPLPKWNTQHARKILTYSGGLYGNSILTFFTAYGSDIIIGGFLNATAVGLFRMGARTSTAAYDIFSQTTRILSWQVLGRLAREERITEPLWVKLYAANLLLVGAALGSMAVLGEDLTRVVLDERWLGMVPILQIVCMVRIVACFELVATAQLAAAGKTGFLFQARMIEAAVLAVALLVSVQFGMKAVAFGLLPSAICLMGILLFRVRRLTGTSLRKAFWQILPSVLIALSAIIPTAIAAYMLADVSPLHRLLLASLVGIFSMLIAALIIFRSWTMGLIHELSVAVLPRAEEEPELAAGDAETSVT